MQLLAIFFQVCFDIFRIQRAFFLSVHRHIHVSLRLVQLLRTWTLMLVSVFLLDLRDPSTIPLNFTKSINLALSERGINAMKQSGRTRAIDIVLNEAIPMHGRMIHGRDVVGKPSEEAQAYDVHGRVSVRRQFNNPSHADHPRLLTR